MKNSFILVLILIILALVTGCKVTNGDQPISSDLRPSLSIYEEYYGDIRIIYPMESRYGVIHDKDYIETWENYIKNKYGYNIDLIYTQRNNEFYSSQSDVVSGIIMDEIEKASNYNGLIYIRDPSDLNTLALNGLIIPINTIAQSIQNSYNVDPGLLNSLTDSKSQIWGIPLQSKPYYVSRVYDEFWLILNNNNIPKSINEFYNYAKFISEVNLDESGFNKSYITWYSLDTLEADFLDVFRAFGCYTSETQSPIAFNPISWQYEVIGLSENFKKAMHFIKNLIDEDLVKKVDQYERRNYWDANYKICSAMSMQYRYLNVENYKFGFYLSGDNSEYLIEKKPLCILAVLKDTEYALEQMSKFLDSFNISQDSYYDFMFGIKGYDYFQSGDLYKRITKDNLGKMKQLIGIETYFYESLNIETNNSDEIFYLNASEYNAIKEGEQSLPENLQYTVPIDILNSNINRLNWQIKKETHELYANILVKNVFIDDAIEIYKKELESLGILDALFNINNQ